MLQLSTLAWIGAGLWCWPGKCHLCLITCTMNHFYFIASPLQYESFACCPFQPLWLSVDHIVLRMLIKTETSHSSLLLGMLVIPTYFNGWRGDTFWGPLLQFHCRLFSSFLLQRPDFTPDSRSRICADHFAPDSFASFSVDMQTGMCTIWTAIVIELEQVFIMIGKADGCYQPFVDQLSRLSTIMVWIVVQKVGTIMLATVIIIMSLRLTVSFTNFCVSK